MNTTTTTTLTRRAGMYIDGDQIDLDQLDRLNDAAAAVRGFGHAVRIIGEQLLDRPEGTALCSLAQALLEAGDAVTDAVNELHPQDRPGMTAAAS